MLGEFPIGVMTLCCEDVSSWTDADGVKMFGDKTSRADVGSHVNRRR